MHEQLGITTIYITTPGNKLKNSEAISTDTKVKLLKKSGYANDNRVYNQKYLVSLLTFYTRTSKVAREQRIEYIIEKWEAQS